MADGSFPGRFNKTLKGFGSSAFPVDLNDVRFKSTGNKRRILI